VARAVGSTVIGDDEAITSEPSEEPCERPWLIVRSRTERVQPVIAGEVEWCVTAVAHNQGGTADHSN